ncbi:MAG: ZIP family metal transporter [Acidimicrobiales bacterium]
MEITVLAAAIAALSFVGGLAPRTFIGRLSSSQLADITGVASGLLLASALLVVIPEGFDVASAAAEPGETFAYEPAVLGATVLVGFLVMMILEGFGAGHDVHEEHHDHAEGHGHGHVHHPTSASVMALGLSVHAIADGVAIGAASVAGDTTFSVLVAMAVVIHRVPAAFSLGMFALHETDDAGRSTRALLAFALATPLAMLVTSAALDSADDRFIALVLLFSAGTFAYVATVDTLPAIHNPDTGRRSVRNVLIGAAILSLLVFLADASGLLEHSH